MLLNNTSAMVDSMELGMTGASGMSSKILEYSNEGEAEGSGLGAEFTDDPFVSLRWNRHWRNNRAASNLQ